MKLQDSVAFVTGANRGLGLAFVHALQAAGVRKIYAAARDPKSIRVDGVTPVRLDVTNPEQVAAAVREAGDVTLLINNAGISRNTSLLGEGTLDDLRAEMETNFFGVLATTRAFAPVLARNGGGAIVNVLSALSWVSMPLHGTYSTTKSAAWSLTNGVRHELRAQGTQVLGLHVGYMDTGMTEGIDSAKSSPDDVARQALAALAAGKEEILADEISRQVKAGLSAEPGVYLS